MSEKDVVYEGKPLRIFFDGATEECRPRIRRNECGGIDLEFWRKSGNVAVIIITSSRPILAYRIIELIRILERVDDSVKFYISSFANGSIHEFLEGEIVDDKLFQEIMKMTIPPEIIKAITENRNLDELAEIKSEISWGRIESPEQEKVISSASVISRNI